MIPKLVIHNSISLDGSTTGFTANLDVHYGILGSYEPDAMIVGSNTAKTGTQFFAKKSLLKRNPISRNLISSPMTHEHTG